MALVKCPDCGKSISDLAPACPTCGRPTTAGGQPAGKRIVTAGGKKLRLPRHGTPPPRHVQPDHSRADVQTVELTSKHLKAQGCFAASVFFLGLLLAMIGAAVAANEGSIALAVVGGILAVVGLVMTIVNRVRIWWAHG